MEDLIGRMSCGNTGAMTLIKEMLERDPSKAFLLIYSLERIDIKGEDLHILYNDCANRDMVKFTHSVYMLMENVFDMELVKDNFNYAKNNFGIPLIGNTEISDKFISEGKELSPLYQKEWKEYCLVNNELFIKNAKEMLGRQNIK